MKKRLSSRTVPAPCWWFLLLVLTGGCAAPQSPAAVSPTPQASASDTSDSSATGDGTLDLSGPAERACAAYASQEVDPMKRWIRAFPLRQGGAVMVFTGVQSEQMEVEAALEMGAIAGYEDYSCGTAVVVWVPGIRCPDDAAPLAGRVEESTTMSHLETSCFAIEEIRMRIQEECGRGTLPPQYCH